MGFPPIPERAPKSAENRTFCVKSAQKMRKKCGFPHFWALFLESAETPLFLQINVFAVWALRLDRKYTSPTPQATARAFFTAALLVSLRCSMTSILSGPVLRDTARLSQRYPPIARYGVFDVSTWPIGCDTPSPFSERFPRGEHAKWKCDTPPLRRGISAILARYPMKTRQMGAIPPSAILSRKGIARYGGVSRTGPLSFHT